MTGMQAACYAAWDAPESGDACVFLLPFIYTCTEDLLGLILIPTGNEKGQYERVGYFETNSRRHLDVEEGELSNPIKPTQAIRNLRNRAPEEAFASFVGHGDEQWGVVNII